MGDFDDKVRRTIGQLRDGDYDAMAREIAGRRLAWLEDRLVRAGGEIPA